MSLYQEIIKGDKKIDSIIKNLSYSYIEIRELKRKNIELIIKKHFYGGLYTDIVENYKKVVEKYENKNKRILKNDKEKILLYGILKDYSFII